MVRIYAYSLQKINKHKNIGGRKNYFKAKTSVANSWAMHSLITEAFTN